LPFCKKCELHKDVNKQCMPRGTTDPEIYLVGEAPGKQEDQEGVPFVGRSGKYLTSVCDSLDITEENSRWFNVVRCIPKNKEGRGSVRAPEDKEISKCHQYLVTDIIKTNPKVIISLGTTATKYFFDYHLKDRNFTRISDVKGRAYNFSINNNDYILVPAYHPAYLIRKQNVERISEGFFADLKKAKKISLEKEEVQEKELLSSRSYVDFKKFYLEEIKDADFVSYDIESNYKFPLAEDAKVVGFSIASNVHKGMYVVFESLEYKMPEDDRKKIEKLLKKILLTKRVIVQNLLMEMPFTLNWLGIEIDDIDDVMMQSRLLLGGQSGAGLKNQATKIGYEDWSKDLYFFRGLLHNIYKRLKMTASGNTREEFDILRNERSILKLNQHISNYNEENLNTRQLSLKESLEKMVDFLEGYYDKDELENVSRKLALKLAKRISLDLGDEGKPESYGWIPERVISKYGALDAIAPIDVYDNNLRKMDEISKQLDIDLHRGYKYWLQHIKAGYKLELNGAFWDEDIVKKEMKDILPDGLQAHINLIKSSLIKYDDIFEGLGCNACPGLKEPFAKYLYDYYVGSILKDIKSHEDVNFARINDNGDIEVGLDGKKDDSQEDLTLFQNENIMLIERGNSDLFDYVDFNDYKDAYDDFLDKTIEEAKKEDYLDDIEKLKFIMNPMSTDKKFRNLVEKCIVTGEVKLAKIYREISSFTSRSNFDIEDLETEEDKLFIKKYMAIDDREDFTASKKLEKFALILKNIHPNDYNLKRIIRECFNYGLKSLSEEDILDVYESYLLTGIDPENEDTWNENFRWLFNYRVYKKISKMYTTYVNGNVGRETVWVGDKEKFVRGDKFVPRKRTFYENRRENNGQDIIGEDEVFIYQPDFSVCTAMSGRWRSGFHTLPWRSPPQRFFTSRFKGGTIAMPDFCLTGDTKIKMLDGESKTIEELSEEYGTDKSFWVYSYDRILKEVVPSKAKNVRKTKVVNKLYKIKLDNGKVIRCTGNHPFLLRNNEYRRADNLSIGDSLMSLYYRYSEHKFLNGYEEIKHPDKSWEYTHHLVSGKFHNFREANSRTQIYRHHRNGNKLDNRAENFARNYNHKIVDIEIVEVDNIDVYDLEVDKYHNFAIDFPGDKSGIFVHNSQMEVRALAASANEERMLEDYRNGLDAHISTATGMFDKKPEEVTTAERRFAKGGTFSIVYGSEIQSFADTYLDGDIKEAEKIFDDFFEAYSKIREWIDQKHREYEELGKVTLFTDRFINIIPGGGYNAEDRAKRQSQNLPIQGGSSDLVGSVLYKVINFIEEKGYKSKAFAFVHDSIEIDIPPEEFLEVSDKIVEYMNEYPDEEFGVPARADLAIGYSLGEEIEVPKFYISDDYNEGIFLLEGFENEIDKLINSWEECGVFRLLETDLIEKEEEYMEIDEFFQKKRAYTTYLGQTRFKCKKRVKMKY